LDRRFEEEKSEKLQLQENAQGAMKNIDELKSQISANNAVFLKEKEQLNLKIHSSIKYFQNEKGKLDQINRKAQVLHHTVHILQYIFLYSIYNFYIFFLQRRHHKCLNHLIYGVQFYLFHKIV